MRVATLASWVSALISTRASSCAWGNVCYKDHSVNAQPLEEIQHFRALTDTQFFVSIKQHIYWCCVFISTLMTKSCKVVCKNKRCNYLRRHTVPIRRSLLSLEKGGNIISLHWIQEILAYFVERSSPFNPDADGFSRTVSSTIPRNKINLPLSLVPGLEVSHRSWRSGKSSTMGFGSSYGR